ncbi:hypothetical protein INT44_008525 [Umbelopsis vinacea]|uniref:Uncharacterized protein n=1 Tax=Umbelopsis vinacea TaxID=44442 RepID=A0A8H7PXT5_9FUNG|nr:hypothetical protein INT44_008525 [Umbelopsis vinacea]
MSQQAVPFEIVNIIYEYVDCWDTRLSISLACREFSHELNSSITNLALPLFSPRGYNACKLAFNTTTVAKLELQDTEFPKHRVVLLKKYLRAFNRLQILLIVNSNVTEKSLHRLTAVLAMERPHLEVCLDHDDSIGRWVNAFRIRHRLVSHNIKVSCQFDDLHISLADDSQSQHEQSSGEDKFHISNIDSESRLDLDSNDLCETEPGGYSLDFIKAEKIRSIVSGQARVRNRVHDSSAALPRALDKVMDGDIIYKIAYEEHSTGDILPLRSYTMAMVENSVTDISSKYVEAVVYSNRIWFYVTHLNSFLQQGNGYDDCALPRKQTQDDGKPKAYIVNKQEHSAVWKELVIRVDNLELLVLGGFMGEIVSKKRVPFLGPSLNKEVIKLIDESEVFEILIPSAPVPCISAERSLRSYHRLDANRLWSFESARYAKTDFRLCHPLAYDMHTSRKVSIYPTASSLISAVLSIITVRRYSRSRRQQLLGLLAKSWDGCLAIQKYPKTHIETLSGFKQIIVRAAPKSSLLRPLQLLVKFDVLLGNKNEVSIAAHLPLVSKEALYLYKSVLAPAVKTANRYAINSLMTLV